MCRKYGLVCAGGGAAWWKPLRHLAPGHRVFAYVGGAGYVGIGEVIGTLRPFSDFLSGADGQETKIVDQDDVPDFIRQFNESLDPDVWEYAVPVRWLVAVDLQEAFSKPGLFSIPMSACRLRDERTIVEVSTAFGVD